MSKRYEMRLAQLVRELSDLLARHGDVEVVLEMEDTRGYPDESAVDHVEAFHVHGDVNGPMVVAVSGVGRESEG